MNKQVEERLSFYESGTVPRKNIDVMHETAVKVQKAKIDAEAKASASKPAKRKKSQDDDEVDVTFPFGLRLSLITAHATGTKEDEKKEKKEKKIRKGRQSKKEEKDGHDGENLMFKTTRSRHVPFDFSIHAHTTMSRLHTHFLLLLSLMVRPE